MSTIEIANRAENEVQSCLLTATNVTSNVNIFKWWNSSKTIYPNVSALARKWLSCPATSVPSERVFSHYELVQTAKRNRLIGKAIKEHVMVYKKLAL